MRLGVAMEERRKWFDGGFITHLSCIGVFVLALGLSSSLVRGLPSSFFWRSLWTEERDEQRSQYTPGGWHDDRR